MKEEEKNEILLKGLGLLNNIGEDEKCFEYNIELQKANCSIATHLDASNNRLTSFKFDGVFFPVLTELNLSKNNIDIFEFSHSGGVKITLSTLNLSNNKLREFPKCIQGMTQLTKLDLSYNYIPTFTGENFQQLTLMTTLDLSNNKIDFSSVENFVSSTLPLTSSMKKLEKLNIEDNLFSASNPIFSSYYFVYFLHKAKNLKYLNSLSVKSELGGSVRSDQKSQLAVEKMKSAEKQTSGSVKFLFALSQAITTMSNLSDFDIEKLNEIRSTYLKAVQREDVYLREDDPESLSAKAQEKEVAEYKIINKVLNQLKEISENTKIISEFTLVTAIKFTGIRKGKFCFDCFNLITHVLLNSKDYETFFDNHFVAEFGMYFDLLADIGSDLRPSPEKGCDMNIIAYLHLVVKFMRLFISHKYPKIFSIVAPASLKPFLNNIFTTDRIVATLYEIDSLICKRNEEGNKNDVGLNTMLYNAIMKMNVMKYGLVNLSLCFKVKFDYSDEEKNKIAQTFYRICRDLVSMVFFSQNYSFNKTAIKNVIKEVDWMEQSGEVNKSVYSLTQKVQRKFFKILIIVVRICKKICMKEHSVDVPKIILELDKSHNENGFILQIHKLFVDYFISGLYFTVKESENKKINNNLIFIYNTLNAELFKFNGSYFVTYLPASDEVKRKEKNMMIDIISTLYTKMYEGKELKRENFDPVVFQAMNYVLHLLLTNCHKVFQTDFDSYIRFFREKVFKIVTISIGYLDTSSQAYNHLTYNSIYYSSLSFDVKEEIVIKPLKDITNFIMIKYIASIIKILTYLGKEDEKLSAIPSQKDQKDDPTQTYLAQIKTLNQKLNELDRDNILINILKVDNHKLKSLVIQCFTLVSPDQLSTSEVKELSSTMKSTNWVYKMEHIFGETFFLIGKIFDYNFITLKSSSLPAENFELVEIGLNILEKNNEYANSPFFYERSLLNASIVTFLMKLSSNSKNSKKLFRKFNSDSYRKGVVNVLSKESKLYASSVGGEYLFPLDIEKILCMWSIEEFVLAIAKKAVECYTYISLRLLIHIANVLNNKPYKLFDADKYNNITNEMFLEIRKFFQEKEIVRIKRERLPFNEEIDTITVAEIEKKGLEKQYIYIKSKTFILSQQQFFVKSFNSFLGWVWAESCHTTISDIYHSLKTEDNKFYDLEHMTKFNLYKEKKKHSENTPEIRTTDENGKTTFGLLELTKFLCSIKPFPLAENYGTPINKASSSWTDIYGEVFPPLRKKEDELIGNPKLRSLMISAFLRCIYSIINPNTKNMPNGYDNKQIKTEFISYLRNNDLLVRRLIILILCSPEPQCASKGTQILLLILNNISIECNEVKMLINVENLIIASTVFIIKNISILKNEMTANYDKGASDLMHDLSLFATTLYKEVIDLTIIEQKKRDIIITKIISTELINVSISSLCHVMGDPITTPPKYNFMIQEIMKLFLVYMEMGNGNDHCEFIMESLFKSLNVNKFKIRKIFIKELTTNIRMRKALSGLKEQKDYSNAGNCYDCIYILGGEAERIILVDCKENYFFAEMVDNQVKMVVKKKMHIAKKDIFEVFISQNRNCVFVNIRKGEKCFCICFLFIYLYSCFDFINSLAKYSEKNNRTIYFDQCEDFTPEQRKNELISEYFVTLNGFFDTKMVFAELLNESLFQIDFDFFNSSHKIMKNYRYIYFNYANLNEDRASSESNDNQSPDDQNCIQIFKINKKILECSKKDLFSKHFLVDYAGEYISCFEIDETIKNNQINGLRFKSTDKIDICYFTRSLGTNITKTLSFQFFDDVSYFIAKCYLITFAKKNNLQIS